jgi:hypothetical protein
MLIVVYYESIKRELKIRGINEKLNGHGGNVTDDGSGNKKNHPSLTKSVAFTGLLNEPGHASVFQHDPGCYPASA